MYWRDNPSGAFLDLRRQYETAGAKIIASNPGQTLEDALAQIQPPAHIILAAHGNPKGMFQWNKQEDLAYDRLFSALPRTGISSITLLSCFGGKAMEQLAEAPPGAVVFSLVGAENVSINSQWNDFSIEALKDTDPVDIYLEILDGFVPDQYPKAIGCTNLKENTDAAQALPYLIGIGGRPTRKIDLNEAMQKMGEQGARLSADPAWKQASMRARNRFDSMNYKVVYNGNDNKTCINPQYLDSAEERQQIDARFASVAEKIERGAPPADTDERRVAYALTMTYLYESGELTRWRKEAIGPSWQGGCAIYDETLRELKWIRFHETMQHLGKGDVSEAMKASTATALPPIDGMDGAPPDDAISLEELQLTLLRHNILSLEEIDTDGDHIATVTEIAAALRKNSEKTR